MKPNIQLITAAVLSIGGLVLLFCGAFIAPQGEIHESLLVGFGEVATFAGALFGIDYTYRFRNQSEWLSEAAQPELSPDEPSEAPADTVQPGASSRLTGGAASA